MNILISGSSGLIGSALIPFLSERGHSVIRLVRHPPHDKNTEIYWNPEARKMDTSSLKEIHATIHLAGENIFGRWTEEKKEKIRSSRVESTSFLSRTLSELANPPRILLCASAIGFYGNRGEEILEEESPAGKGFLAEVCQEWEKATESALKRGIRVINLRIGTVLSPQGGALAKMLPPFKSGLGGRLGEGKQYLSWIALDDLLDIILFVLKTETLQGPLNAVSPFPVTNLEFTKTLGKVLKRPTPFPVPAFILRWIFGEMTTETVLASARVEPHRLLSAGFKFRYPDLESALKYLLQR